jgi:hypothetical protein
MEEREMEMSGETRAANAELFNLSYLLGISSGIFPCADSSRALAKPLGDHRMGSPRNDVRAKALMAQPKATHRFLRPTGTFWKLPLPPNSGNLSLHHPLFHPKAARSEPMEAASTW